MNAADARDNLANGDAADRQAAIGWMEQHTEMHMTENKMMPTPRTDAAQFTAWPSPDKSSCYCVHSDLARQLERELAAMRERAEKAEAERDEARACLRLITDKFPTRYPTPCTFSAHVIMEQDQLERARAALGEAGRFSHAPGKEQAEETPR